MVKKKPNTSKEPTLNETDRLWCRCITKISPALKKTNGQEDTAHLFSFLVRHFPQTTVPKDSAFPMLIPIFFKKPIKLVNGYKYHFFVCFVKYCEPNTEISSSC